MVFGRVCAVLFMVFAAASARAAEPVRPSDLLFRIDSIMVFGGAYTDVNMGRSLFKPLSGHNGSNLAGVAIGTDIAKLPWNFVVGSELGLAGRFGDGSSAELWGAFNLKYRGLVLGNVVTLAPGLNVGLSVVTAPMGLESSRALDHDGNPTLLFYFSPELAFIFHQWPNIELVLRLHHRSGLNGTLGRMREGSNAHVLGLRWHY